MKSRGRKKPRLTGKTRSEFRHAQHRVAERHGLPFSMEDAAALVRQIQQGRGQYVERQSHRVRVWDVVLHGRPIRVVYDSKRKMIVTTLPTGGAPLDPLTAHCQRCGCTHDHPCPGGCCWDTDAWRRGQAICSWCITADGAA